jgi:hypothetical protein
MAWLDFNRRFTWKPKPGVMQDFGPGHANVTTACAKKAIEAGAGVRIRAPSKGGQPISPNLEDFDGDGGPGGDAAAAKPPAGEA